MYGMSSVSKVKATNNRDAQRHAGIYDALILDARLRQALVSLRSLGQRGMTVAALETCDGVPAFFSRWCRQRYVCPAGEGTTGYLAYLEDWLQQIGTHVLIPASDGTIALLRQHRAALERHTRVALAADSVLAIAVNKERTLAMAQELGLHVPRGVTVSSVSEVGAALREVGLPVVIKPVESWVSCEQQRVASQLVVSLDEAQRVVEALTCSGGAVLFQQFLTGRREAISFLFADGEIYARFAQWAKRTEPPLGGQSVLRQSISVPSDSGEQAERLIRTIGLDGYSEVEFRRDSSGRPFLMEINPRLSASVEIAVRSGVDFPLLLYQWACGEPIQKIERYRVGGWMRYLKGDMMTTLETFQQRGRPGVVSPGRAAIDFCLSFVQPMGYDYVDWHDPLPALHATADFTARWVGGAIQKRFARIRRKYS
jgi:predicted ATP-grasp superfamily ATP-dependent carboligase